MPRGRHPGPGNLYRRGRQWTLDYRDSDGRRRYRALSTDLRTAEQIRARIIHERDLARCGLLDVVGQERLVREVVEAFLEELPKRAARQYVYQTKKILDAFVAQHGATMIKNLRVGSVLTVRDEVLAKGRSVRTANQYVQAIKSAFSWAATTGLIAASPVAKAKQLQVHDGHMRRRRRALTEDEIGRLLAAVDASDVEYARLLARNRIVRIPQRLLFQTLIETGCRWNEIRLLRWADVDFATRVITLRAETTKSKRTRFVPIRTELVEELRWLKAFHERALGRIPRATDPVFLSPVGRIWNQVTANLLVMLRRHLVRAGIPRVDGQGRTIDIHAMRHTAASRMVRANVSVTFAQRLLGHSDPRLTEKIYLHLEIEDLRAAVEKVGAIAKPAGAMAAG